MLPFMQQQRPICEVLMAVLSYLQVLSSQAILSKREMLSIQRSIDALHRRLTADVGSVVQEQLRFGSSTRGTILPRSMDEHSDIDYMVVFKSDGATPQTYLDRLKRFALANYPSAYIKQSFPTIVLELNHIKFDLVPALRSFWHDYKIAGPEGSWRGCSPSGFRSELTERNQSCHALLKPTIRLLKLWNAKHGYVFESYLLEKQVVNNLYPFCSNLREYFFKAIDDLEKTGIGWKDEHIRYAKAAINEVRRLEEGGKSAEAEALVSSLFH